MKKSILLLFFFGAISLSIQAQDSTKSSFRKTTRKIGKDVKIGARATGKAFDTATSKTGKFVKKSANRVAATVSSSPDKSMKGPNGELVYNGPRGGKYYLNKAGTKVYLKKDKKK